MVLKHLIFSLVKVMHSCIILCGINFSYYLPKLKSSWLFKPHYKDQFIPYRVKHFLKFHSDTAKALGSEFMTPFVLFIFKVSVLKVHKNLHKSWYKFGQAPLMNDYFF